MFCYRDKLLQIRLLQLIKCYKTKCYWTLFVTKNVTIFLNQPNFFLIEYVYVLMWKYINFRLCRCHLRRQCSPLCFWQNVRCSSWNRASRFSIRLLCLLRLLHLQQLLRIVRIVFEVVDCFWRTWFLGGGWTALNDVFLSDAIIFFFSQLFYNFVNVGVMFTHQRIEPSIPCFNTVVGSRSSLYCVIEVVPWIDRKQWWLSSASSPPSQDVYVSRSVRTSWSSSLQFSCSRSNACGTFDGGTKANPKMALNWVRSSSFWGRRYAAA